MIVYLASYPRSGNSRIQLLISKRLRKLVSSVYNIGDYPEAHIKKWEIVTQETPPSLEKVDSKWRSQIPHLIWNKSIALYQDPKLKQKYPNYVSRFILPGCLEFLTPANRKQLAAETEVFVIKTHELPYAEYFSGEKVIQPIRNPGAVIWSYYQIINATKAPGEAITEINDCIVGRVKYGSWSDYHQKWLQASQQLQDNYLPIYFESLVDEESEHQCCQKIASFTGLEYSNREYVSFTEINQKNPIAKREGKAFGWEENFTKKQLKLIYATHSAMMDKLGYEIPKQ